MKRHEILERLQPWLKHGRYTACGVLVGGKRTCGCGLDAAIAALANEAEVDAWQPFDSAPKDGTHVLMFRPGHGVEEAWWKKDAGMNGVHWGGNGFWYVPDSLPTHWQPLPYGPESRG